MGSTPRTVAAAGGSQRATDTQPTLLLERGPVLALPVDLLTFHDKFRCWTLELLAELLEASAQIRQLGAQRLDRLLERTQTIGA